MTTGLEFHLSEPLSVDAPTYARFSVRLNGEGLWPVAGDDCSSMDVFIDDILDYLADFWMPLLLRQTYPLAFPEPPERPSSLAAAAGRRWLQMPESQVETEQSLVSAFEEAHNLALCFDGQFGLPSLWLLRNRDELIIDTEDRLCRVEFKQALGALVGLGDDIALRLEKADTQRTTLIEAWRSRDESSGARMLEFSAGLSSDKAEALVRSNYLAEPASIIEAANDDDEILVAARMAGALPLEDIKRIIKLAKGFALHPSEPLAKLGHRTRQHLANKFAGAKPYELGEAAARFCREALRTDVDDVFDVRALATQLGIEVKELPLSMAAMVGLAISGRKHGPGVLLNSRSYHLQNVRAWSREARTRYTLAHEICHLLLDGDHSFTAVDVLSGRMHPALESRAQSFAGELLFPTKCAGALWKEHGSPITATALDLVIKDAVERYHVTRSVAAWKIEHAASEADVDLHRILNSLARYR